MSVTGRTFVAFLVDGPQIFSIFCLHKLSSGILVHSYSPQVTHNRHLCTSNLSTRGGHAVENFRIKIHIIYKVTFYLCHTLLFVFLTFVEGYGLKQVFD